MDNLCERGGIVLPITKLQSTKENQNDEMILTHSVKDCMKLLSSQNGNLENTNERNKVERRNPIRLQTQVSIL